MQLSTTKTTGTVAFAVTIICLISIPMKHCYAGKIDYTLGKNFTAKMSSKFVASDDASLAYDGKIDGSYNPGAPSLTCIHVSSADLQPWWMLDMLTVRLISGIRVWNRVDCCSNKFSGVTFGVSSIDSVWSNFNLSLFDICYFYTGSPTAAQNPLNFNCYQPVAGRYLTVYRDTLGVVHDGGLMWFFHFCEIDIFAFSKVQPHTFLTTDPRFSDTATAHLQTADEAEYQSAVASRSIIMLCLMQCGSHPSCLYALYSRNQCYMFSSVVIPSSLRNLFNSSAEFKAVSVV